MIQQYFYLGQDVDQGEVLSVMTMIFGAIVAAWGDLTFDLVGYVITLINCFFTAWYLITIATTKKATGLDTFGLMYYNNILSLPVVLCIVYLLEMDQIQNFHGWRDPYFLTCFFMSSVQAILLNYTIFLCSIYNSPLVTSVTGQIKAVIQTVVGLFTFGKVPLTIPLVSGLFIGTAASFWYTYIKYEQQIHQEKLKNKVSNV
jgi:solute carrier family 35 protein